jgi:hypothetical protein
MAPQARIEDLVVPRAKERGPIEVDFTYTAERSPIVALDVVLATPLGALHELLPASIAGIEGPRGAGRIELDVRSVPPGASELTLAPVQEDGKVGEPARAGLEVPGGGGRGPRLRGVSPLDERVTRPGGDDVVLARLTVAAAPGDDELVTTWTSLRQPDGTETAAAAPAPPEGKGNVAFAAFAAGHELGKYGVAVTLLDAAGNVSETHEAAIELVADGGAQGPSIEGFKPTAAAAGDEVVVRGRALDAEGLTVEVGGIPAAVLAADAGGLRIRMPAVDAPARIAVTGPAGTGLSAEQLVPRAQVRVVPETIDVPEGASVALSAVVTGTTDGAVEWSAAARGGEPGSISPDGVYTPPPGGVRGAVTISAASADVVGRARVRVVAHPPARGPLRLGPLGGTVRSQDDACALNLPRGAVGELTTIGVEPTLTDLDGDDLGGEMVVAGARIEGLAGALGTPAELTLPLRFPLLEGEKVKVQFRDDPLEPWQDLPDFGVVIPPGEVMKIRLDSLHGYYQGKFEYTPGTTPATPSYLPSITSLGPSAVDEGATVAVLVTGKNFVPGLSTVSVLTQAGGVESRVQVRTVHVTADGTKLGVTLKAGVMTDLAEGSTRQLRLRVATPAGSAEHTFDIVGHDELDVQGTVTVSQSRTFSRVTVAPGATLRIAHTSPPVTVTAFETFVVGGAPGRADVDVITGSGTPGTRGDGAGAGGAGGVTAAVGAVAGSGGAGGSGGTGSSGNGTSGGAGTAPAGKLAGAGGARGIGGWPYGFDGANGSAAPMPPFPTPGFVPELVGGAGGGGAGGGGGEGVWLKDTAGGGGGAGAGGGALALAAGEELRIRGRVAANGGNGGDGAFPFAVGTPPAPPPFHAGCGGGGGAGAGGGIALHGVRQMGGEVLAVSGTNGTAARFAGAVITTPDTRTPLQKLLANPHSGLVRIDGAPPTTATIAPGAFSVPDLDYRPNLVAPASQLVVEGVTAGLLRLQNSAGQQFVVASGSPFAATVPLAPGFNDVDGVVVIGSGAPGDPFIVLAAAAPVRRRRILYMPGVVAIFGFTCTISPPTPTVATERSVKLTAAVTGTAQSAVTWSVDGGSANGAVAQDGTYRAPCNVPASAVTVRATSAFDPNRSGTASVTVIAGVSLTAQATVGTPADPTAPSANVGQAITVAIPPATYAVTSEGFAAAQNVVFETISRDANGACVAGTTPVTSTVATGLKSLQATVPPCAAPDQRIRVTGHGCARLQVVPRITSLNRSASLGQSMAVNGGGFACGATQVFFGATQVPAAQVLSVDCGVILLGARPAAGQQVTVRTAGGTSNGVA